MNEFICKACGAAFAVPEGEVIQVCRACGAPNTSLPEMRDTLSTLEPARSPRADEACTSTGQATPGLGRVLEEKRDTEPLDISWLEPDRKSMLFNRIRLPSYVPYVIWGLTIISMAIFVTRQMLRSAAESGKPAVVELPVDKGPIEEHLLVSDWLKADGMAVATKIEAQMRHNWRAGASCGRLELRGVMLDGNTNLMSPSGSITLTCYDTQKPGGIPAGGGGRVRRSSYKVVVSGGNVVGEEEENEATGEGPPALSISWPDCGLAELRRSAAEAGWPADGQATVVWPAIPEELTPAAVEAKLQSAGVAGEEIDRLMASNDWIAESVKYYLYAATGVDASDRPSYFEPKECKPVDPDAMQQDLVRGLLSGCETCKGPLGADHR